MMDLRCGLRKRQYISSDSTDYSAIDNPLLFSRQAIITPYRNLTATWLGDPLGLRLDQVEHFRLQEPGLSKIQRVPQVTMMGC